MNRNLQSTLVFESPTQKAVRAQLDRILSSSLFRYSPQISRFLSFVVQAVLSGQTQRIKQYTIAVEAFGYPEDFDPLTNTIVRVLAGRLRGMLARYYLQEGEGDEIRIEIPKHTYVPIFRFISASQPDIKTKTRVARKTIAVADYGPSIAIITFSGNNPQEDRCPSENIMGSVVAGLAQFQELSVVGPLRKRTVEPKAIGRRYHVRFVLQGGIQVQGEILRIRLSLMDTCTGFNIWSQTYEYTQTGSNLFEIQDSITQRVASALADYGGIIPCLISRESMKKSHENLEIHEAIYRHEHFLMSLTTDSYLAAVGALEHAVKVNPNNPILMAMLSNAYCYNYILDMGLAAATLEEAGHMAQRAVELDPECQIAHLSEAFLLFFNGRADQCISKIRLTISLNPFNAYIIYISGVMLGMLGSGVMLGMLGYWEESMQLWEKVIRLNPQHPSISTHLSVPLFYYYFRSDYKTAWEYAKLVNTPVFWDPLIRAAAAGQLGFHDQAKKALQELLEMCPDFPSRARDLMSRVVYLREHIELLSDGLIKAGLKLGPALSEEKKVEFF